MSESGRRNAAVLVRQCKYGLFQKKFRKERDGGS